MKQKEAKLNKKILLAKALTFKLKFVPMLLDKIKRNFRANAYGTRSIESGTHVEISCDVRVTYLLVLTVLAKNNVPTGHLNFDITKTLPTPLFLLAQ